MADVEEVATALAERPGIGRPRDRSARPSALSRLDRPRGSRHPVSRSVLGAVSFLWPLHPARRVVEPGSRRHAPWVIAALLPVLLVAVLGEFSSGGMDAKGVAMLACWAPAALRCDSLGLRQRFGQPPSPSSSCCSRGLCARASTFASGLGALSRFSPRRSSLAAWVRAAVPDDGGSLGWLWPGCLPHLRAAAN